MVPIRDPGLIGRKIDCPKCKYRFVVEEPVPEEDADDEEPKRGTVTLGGNPGVGPMGTAVGGAGGNVASARGCAG